MSTPRDSSTRRGASQGGAGARAAAPQYRASLSPGAAVALLLCQCDPIALGSLATDGGVGGQTVAWDEAEAAPPSEMQRTPPPAFPREPPRGNGTHAPGGAGAGGAGALLDAGRLDAALPGDEGSSSHGNERADAGVSGSASVRPSCASDDVCGERRESCCEAALVPRGSIVQGDDTLTAASYVSSFYFDNYEVTIARFARFVRDYDAWRGAGNPVQGAGALPAASETGWQRRWDAALPPSGEALWQAVQACDGFPEMSVLEASDTPESAAQSAEGSLRPINCLTWFEAHLFCTWDGARLPTELEWEFAAAGGQQERTYPWGEAPEPQADLAVFDCNFLEAPADAGAHASCLPALLPGVGSAPSGRGRFGQEDLAGSMAEWLLDGAGLFSGGCLDCVAFESDGQRMFRGGHWLSRSFAELRATTRNSTDPGSRFGFLGLRCARRNYR